MGRILAIDYGAKRSGFAWTDMNRIIATPLDPCKTENIFDHLYPRLENESIDLIVIGKPLKFDNSHTHITDEILEFGKELQSKYPHIPCVFFDERFTSIMAKNSMIEAGATKAQKKNKMLINSISATILLQSYLETIS